MCILCSRKVTIFSYCSYPRKPQYAWFLVITFLAIIGCFCFCIQTRWMARKKSPKNLVNRTFYISYIFHILYWLTCEKMQRLWEWLKQASTYEACDRMCTPLHTPKTLEVWQIAHLIQQCYLSFTFYKTHKSVSFFWRL